MIIPIIIVLAIIVIPSCVTPWVACPGNVPYTRPQARFYM